MLIAITFYYCLALLFHFLFIQNLYVNSLPLSIFNNLAFTKQYIIYQLYQKLITANILYLEYSGYNYLKNAV